MKKYLGLIPVAIFAILLGCGGGGGGGGGNGSTNGQTNGATDGFTAGETNAGAGSTIVGRVIYMSNNQLVPIAEPGLTIEFMNSSNQIVGTAQSRANGYFDAAVGTNATKWKVNPQSVIAYNQAHDGLPLPGAGETETVLPPLQNAFVYDEGYYFSSLSTCYTPLPTIIPGLLTPMPHGSARFLLASDVPPPLPGNCIP